MKRTLVYVGLLLVAMEGYADVERMLTLDDCRAFALQATSTQVNDELRAAADLNKQAALAAMFPKITANAAYTWNSQHAVLLANQMDFSAGTAIIGKDGSASWQWNEGSAMNQLSQQTANLPDVGKKVMALQNETGQALADAYQQLYNALDLDMTHLFVGQVGITQPIYVGGRLRELYRIAKATEQATNIEADSKKDDIIVKVDEAYWRVISVQKKKELATTYYNLLVTLENNVTTLVEEGMATQSDLLKVKQKRGEAELKKLQAENGLVLSKMALCQICGFPLEQDVVLDDSHVGEVVLHDTIADYTDIIESRSEIRLLEQAQKIAESNAKIMAAGLQPNIVASANYIYTNPNVENGFSTDWKGHGFFSVGVVVNVPIAHADDILRLKAAKHQAKAVALKTQDAREMLELQITQANQKVLEANQKVVMTELGVKNADEVLRFANEAFQAGMATATDLMQAQTAWLSASSDKIDADVEAQVCETYFKKYTSTLRY